MARVMSLLSKLNSDVMQTPWDSYIQIRMFADLPLNDRQRLGLVYLRQQERITNSDYRCLSRMDAMMAGQELRGLVQTGLVDQQGIGRGTSYTLKALREAPEALAPQTNEDKIIAYVRQNGSITNVECRTLLGIKDYQTYHLLKKLLDINCLKSEALRDAKIAVISGFHSPLEKDCLELLLRGDQLIVICPARNIENMRMPAAWRGPLAFTVQLNCNAIPSLSNLLLRIYDWPISNIEIAIQCQYWIIFNYC